MHARVPERGQHAPLVSLVFPTYNAAAFVERTWRDLTHFLQHNGKDWEVLFVCDGCSDGSTERLQALAANSGGLPAAAIRVLSHTPNRGKGYAVRRGLSEARGQFRIFTDVDLAYPFDDIVRIANVLRNGAEVAIASRLHPQSRLTMPPSVLGYAYRRHLQSFAFSLLVRCILPVAQRDTQAGLKGVSARVAETIVPQLRCDGFGLDCELLTACVRHGVPVTEVPVSVRYEDAASTTGFQSIARMVRDLWEIRRMWPAPGTRVAPMRRRAA
jgi:dolichyl-phosphate beta-glucosyltransferase